MGLFKTLQKVTDKVGSRGLENYPQGSGELRNTHGLLNYLYLFATFLFTVYLIQLTFLEAYWTGLFQLICIGVFLFSFYKQKESLNYFLLHSSLAVIHINMFLFSFYLNFKEVPYLYLGIVILVIVRALYHKRKWMIIHLSIMVGLQFFCFFYTLDNILFISEESKISVYHFHVVFTSFIYFASMLLIVRVWSEKTKLLESEVEQKEVLLAEVNHRVRNNLNVIISLVKLQEQTVFSEESKKVLDTIKGRVYAIAEVHNKLYKSSDDVNINVGEYAKELLEHLRFSRNDDVKVTIDHNDFYLDFERLIPLGLILNELATNSMKHAFENTKNPEISVGFSCQNDICTFDYRDNGSGTDVKIEETEDSDQLGMQIISILSDQVSGKASFDGTEGVHFQLKFKE